MRAIFFVCLLLCVCLVCVSAGFYDSSDRVVDLTPANFNDRVLKSEGIWLVEFYAPWCGHCKSLTGDWKKASLALSGVVNIGAVDADQHKSLGQQFDVRGFPTIKLFGIDKKKPIDYQGARNAQAIVEFALNEAKKAVNDRLSGRAKNTGSSSSSSSSSSRGSGSSSGGGNGKMVELTAASFEEQVANSDDLWMVEFYAPWCGHCKSLEPEWRRAAQTLGGVAKLGAVDATVHQQLAQKFGIRGYPTIKVFKAGSKGKAVDYEGGRTADSIVQYARNLAEANAKPREVVQLTSEDDLKKHCIEGASLCLVSFLPHILDSGAKGRNTYIAVLKELATKYARRPFAYLWLEAGSQMKLEEQLGVGGAGYPAVTALNVKKQRYANMMGTYNANSIGDFLKSLLSGKEATIPLQTPPTIVKADQWDGKDAPAPPASDEL